MMINMKTASFAEIYDMVGKPVSLHKLHIVNWLKYVRTNLFDNHSYFRDGSQYVFGKRIENHILIRDGYFDSMNKKQKEEWIKYLTVESCNEFILARFFQSTDPVERAKMEKYLSGRGGETKRNTIKNVLVD